MRAKNSAKSRSVERRAVLLQERHHLARRCRPCRSGRARRRCRRARPLRLRCALGLDHARAACAPASGSLIVSPGLYVRAVGLQPVLLVVRPASRRTCSCCSIALRRARRAAGSRARRSRSPAPPPPRSSSCPTCSSTVSAACSAPGTTAGIEARRRRSVLPRDTIPVDVDAPSAPSPARRPR